MIYLNIIKHLPFDTEYVDDRLDFIYTQAKNNGVDVKVIDYEAKYFKCGIIDYTQHYFEKYELYLLNKMLKYGKKYKNKDLYVIIKGCNIHPHSEELILKILNLNSTPEVKITYIFSNTRKLSDIQKIRTKISYGLDNKHLNNFDMLYKNYYQGEILDNYPLKYLNSELPKSIIVDIDGTIIFIKDRDYWDMDKSLSDYRIQPTIDIVKNYFKLGYKILFVTSRREMYRDVTMDILNDIFKNETNYDLFMRCDTDLSSHALYKREVLKQQILPKYSVHFVLEDNSSVIDMYRSMGILALQTINSY